MKEDVWPPSNKRRKYGSLPVGNDHCRSKVLSSKKEGVGLEASPPTCAIHSSAPLFPTPRFLSSFLSEKACLLGHPVSKLSWFYEITGSLYRGGLQTSYRVSNPCLSRCALFCSRSLYHPILVQTSLFLH